MKVIADVTKIEKVAIDENTIHTFITKRFVDNTELVWCKETGEATIFAEDAEVECEYSTKLEAVLVSLESKKRWERALIFRRIKIQNS